jgi:predicted dehydrogenase
VLKTDCEALPVLVIGGGMICEVQILPALYQLQRLGLVGDIAVCARHGRTVRKLAGNEGLKAAFPGHSFTPYPDYREVDPDIGHEGLYRECLAAMAPRGLVVMALPDQTHHEAVMASLEAGQHVLAVKPLVLRHGDAVEIERAARQRGLFVGTDYHKRLDDRALMARKRYRSGQFGEFKLGQALLIEPYYYLESNFQNWCTCESSDMFTYVGCHYVDQVHFITGLMPVEVSVHGIVDRYPNGNEGYLWTDARVIWENGGSLSVLNAIGYPNAAPGGNAQGMRLYLKGRHDAGLIWHEDQFRGVRHSLDVKGTDPGDTYYQEPNPDYFQLVYRGGEGLEPVGYGYRSIEWLVKGARRVNAAGDLAARQEALEEIDAEGIIATPANSAFNELVIEAGRLSITNQGRPVQICYDGDTPSVRFKTFDT